MSAWHWPHQAVWVNVQLYKRGRFWFVLDLLETKNRDIGQSWGLIVVVAPWLCSGTRKQSRHKTKTVSVQRELSCSLFKWHKITFCTCSMWDWQGSARIPNLSVKVGPQNATQLFSQNVYSITEKAGRPPPPLPPPPPRPPPMPDFLNSLTKKKLNQHESKNGFELKNDELAFLHHVPLHFRIASATPNWMENSGSVWLSL